MSDEPRRRLSSTVEEGLSSEPTPAAAANSEGIQRKARLKRYAKENATLRSHGISFQKIFMWRQVFEDLLDTDMNGHMEDEDLHKIFEDLEQDMDEEDVADMHGFFGVDGKKGDATPKESGEEKIAGEATKDTSGNTSDAPEGVHSVSFVAFVLAMEKERCGANAKKCFGAVFNMFKAKPKDKTLKKDDLLMGFQMLKAGFADSADFDAFFKVGKKSKGFADTLSTHASYIDDEDVRNARMRKKKKKKIGGDAKATKKKAPAKAVVILPSDKKYAKYFRMAKMLPPAAIVQRAEMDGLSPEEIEALKVATAKK